MDNLAKLLGLINSVLTRILFTFGWHTLRDIQRFSVVKSMNIWLFVVPISAKTFSLLNNTIHLQAFNHVFTLDLKLPFSWQALFFAALMFVIGNILYHMFAPSIVNENRNFSEFINSGRTIDQLEKEYIYYFPEEQKEIKEEISSEGIKNVDESTNRFKNKFWELYTYLCYSRKLIRAVISVFYIFGFALLIDVTIKNIFWVYRSIDFQSFKNQLFFGSIIDFILNRF